MTTKYRQMEARRNDKALLEILGQGASHWRPRTRADCANGQRPCPYMGCRYHLALDVMKSGLMLATGNQRPHHVFNDRREFEEWSDQLVDRLKDMDQTCAIDVAEDGWKTLEEIGSYYGFTRERTRQIEATGIQKLKAMRPKRFRTDEEHADAQS